MVDFILFIIVFCIDQSLSVFKVLKLIWLNSKYVINKFKL